MIADVIARKLLSDDPAAAAIRARLADYADGKAIFCLPAMPEDSGLPAIVIAEAGGASWGCRARPGAEVRVDVQVFGRKGMTTETIRGLARDLWTFLGRSDMAGDMAAAGFEGWGVVAQPPQNTQDGLGFPGYTIPLVCRVLAAG
ncbi:MAG: hypothetical protein N3A38_07600 [Planctomycetota bacterium]|nr:hypothetical protein [Planctomycetota bacterium]